MRVLLVDDIFAARRSLQIVLERSGYVVDTAADGEAAEFLGATVNYDIALLDLGLPKMTGFEVLNRWRKAKNPLPVIILTASDEQQEKINVFKAGADDYVVKPYHVEELLVRMSAVLKRSNTLNQTDLTCCGFTLDESRQLVITNDNQTVALTAIEFRLLRCFMLNRGKILSKSRICEHVYESEFGPESNSLEVYINRLRYKLGKDLIQTRRGQGYIFCELN